MGLNIRRGIMLDPYRRTRDKHWESLLDLRRIIRCQLRIVLRLEIRGAGIVQGLGHRRTMLHPHRRTRNKHWKSQLDLRRNMRRRVRNELSLGNRRGRRCVLGWPWSILDNWATVRYSCFNTPLTLSCSVEQ